METQNLYIDHRKMLAMIKKTSFKSSHNTDINNQKMIMTFTIDRKNIKARFEMVPKEFDNGIYFPVLDIDNIDKWTEREIYAEVKKNTIKAKRFINVSMKEMNVFLINFAPNEI